MSENIELFQRIAVAFAIGLLIGAERGWQSREEREGQRVAGIRTFGLIALTGALTTLLAAELEAALFGFVFVGLAALLIAAQVMRAQPHRDYGITTTVAALLAFILGAVATAGYPGLAAAVAVVATLLLGLKPQLHAWLRNLEQEELFAMLKLLLISVVLLPVLPNANYGPWGALNPREIWWLVVLIAGIGLIGYFAMKIAGPRLGAVLTGIFGGLVSSTAVALSFARLGREEIRLHSGLAAGIVVAAATMFPRILFEVSIINPALLPLLAPVLVAMTVTLGAAAWTLWQGGKREEAESPSPGLQLPNPFELLPALQFGVLLVAIMLASNAVTEWFGPRGVYWLALLSGMADVDAITLSLSRLARDGFDATAAAHGILLAAATNTVTKGVLVAVIGGGRLVRQVGGAFAIAIAVGLLTLAATLLIGR